MPEDQIARMNRAFHPWPGTSTFWGGEALKVVDVEIGDGVISEPGLDAGTVFRADDGSDLRCCWDLGLR